MPDNKPPLSYIDDSDKSGMIFYGRDPREDRPIVIHSPEWKDGQYIRNRLASNSKYISYVICFATDYPVQHICSLLHIPYNSIDTGHESELWNANDIIAHMAAGQFPTRFICFCDETDSYFVRYCARICDVHDIPFEVIHHG